MIEGQSNTYYKTCKLPELKQVEVLLEQRLDA